MANIREAIKRRRPTTRRLSQLYAAMLYNANLKGFIEGDINTGAQKGLCVPGLNCYSCPGAIGACPLGALQNALNAAGYRAPFYILGILLLFGITLGRTICGWFCPMGLLQELLHKIPSPKIAKNRVTRALSRLKYVILGVFVVAMPLWYGLKSGAPLPAFCKYICPAGTLEGAVALLANPVNDGLFAQLGALFTRKFVILVVVLAACVFCHRAFCRFLCPLGAVYGLFNRLALTGVKVDAARCNGCGACARRCPTDVRYVGDSECISCGRCITACAQGAISLKCGKLTLIGPETGKNADPATVVAGRKRRGRVLWGVAVAVLVIALVWFNVVHPPRLPADSRAAQPAVVEETAPPAETGDYADDAPIGYEVGQRLQTFSTPLIGGREFNLDDHRGQVVFINLWGVHCDPCIAELPYFEALKTDHPDIEVLAVHLGLFTDEPQVAKFLEDRDWDHLDFALDDEQQTLFQIVDGSSKLPQTVVLDRNGVVIYNEKRSVTREMLEELFNQADAPSQN